MKIKRWLSVSLLVIQGNLISSTINVTSNADTNTSGDLEVCHSSFQFGTVLLLPALIESLPALTKDLTLVGAGMTIDGSNRYSVFKSL
jgi:hypothetical protein